MTNYNYSDTLTLEELGYEEQYEYEMTCGEYDTDDYEYQQLLMEGLLN